ncbi:hypothetical protein [Coralloluteibacterium stylophorae]|uniref:Uncharacterized protein n=1 Tax=Coralloluteibacterium stylophorae TaxID=1776034 RepID=A0A8J7VT58_9GAMM|nr:hypothetical protein [Coralloluteibacterium stylophorae]MBS7457671.1 hypothetical protein [Coralloluteibacterium stylophorae]
MLRQFASAADDALRELGRLSTPEIAAALDTPDNPEVPQRDLRTTEEPA